MDVMRFRRQCLRWVEECAHKFVISTTPSAVSCLCSPNLANDQMIENRMIDVFVNTLPSRIADRQSTIFRTFEIQEKKMQLLL